MARLKAQGFGATVQGFCVVSPHFILSIPQESGELVRFLCHILGVLVLACLITHIRTSSNEQQTAQVQLALYFSRYARLTNIPYYEIRNALKFNGW